MEHQLSVMMELTIGMIGLMMLMLTTGMIFGMMKMIGMMRKRDLEARCKHG